MELDGSFYGEEKTSAICFGVYQMDAFAKTVKEAYYKLHEEMRKANHVDGDDSTDVDYDEAIDDKTNNKVVRLH
jgi:hypothetical protein